MQIADGGDNIAYILIICASLMWSGVSILVKMSSSAISPQLITFCRFFFGSSALALLFLFSREDRHFILKNKWVWIGALGKFCNYAFENIVISSGSAYKSVVVWPTIVVFHALVAFFYYKEKLTARKTVAVMLCVIGVFLIGTNGAAFSLNWKELGNQLLLIGGGLGAGIFVLAQNKLIEMKSPICINFSMFVLAAGMSVLTFPGQKLIIATPTPFQIGAVISLGLITGISFYMNVKALEKLPLLVISIISNSSVVFTLLWARFLLNEQITLYIIAGSLLFICAVILINIPKKKEVTT